MAAALLDRGPSAPQPEIAQPASERFMPGAKIVALSMIKPNPRQPRKWFDPDALGELAESIRDRGVMQPLVVRPLPEGYGIVVGERRYRAATLAGLAEVPVIVRDTGEEQAYIDALVENLQRSNLTDEEEAEAYRGLMGQGYSARGIAERLKIDISKVSRLTRVFGDPTLAAAVGDGQITKSQAQELLVVPEEEKPRLVQFVATRRKQSQPVSLQELRGEIKKVREGDVLHNTPQPLPGISDEAAVLESPTFADPQAATMAKASGADGQVLHQTVVKDLEDAWGRARMLRLEVEKHLGSLWAMRGDEAVRGELEGIRLLVERALRQA